MSKAPQKPKSDEHSRFQDLAGKILRVPKAEADAKREEWEREQASKREKREAEA